MPVKLNYGSSVISPSEMKDGDLGVITNWGDTRHVGTVVQRYNNYLVAIGKHFNQSWTDVKALTKEVYPNCLVRLLTPGETITIE